MATAKKLPSGSYRVNLYVGKDDTGKRVYKSFTADTKKQAEYLAAQYAIETRHAAQGEDITLAEAYAKYIESKRNVLSPATVREYRRSAGTDLQQLMPKKLRDITQETVQIAVNAEALTHSPKSVRNMHGLLSAVLAVYVPELTLRTTLPQKKEVPLYIPSSEDIERLIDYISGTELEKAVMLAAFGSLRRSEISALMAEDINGDEVTVSKALVKDDAMQWVVKPPKTASGYRTIKMPAFVMERLAGCTGHVCNLAPSTISNRFAEALVSCGLPHFRFHDLRHYQASILHAMGVPDKYIIARGGWKTDSTLKNIYQHTLDEKREKVEDEICSFFDVQHEMQHG